MIALANLGDDRATSRIDARLADEDTLWRLEIEAAAALGEVRWQPRLLQLSAEWADDAEFAPLVEFAARRCDPNAHLAAGHAEADLVVALERQLQGCDLRVGVKGSYPRTRILIADGTGAIVVEEAIWKCAREPGDLNIDQEAISWATACAKAEPT